MVKYTIVNNLMKKSSFHGELFLGDNDWLGLLDYSAGFEVDHSWLSLPIKFVRIPERPILLLPSTGVTISVSFRFLNYQNSLQ